MRGAAVMAIMLAGYSMAMWGYTLIRGYDVTLPQLVSPTKRWGPASSNADYIWPPSLIDDPTVFLPTGASLGQAQKQSKKAPTTQVPPSTPSPFLGGGGRTIA